MRDGKRLLNPLVPLNNILIKFCIHFSEYFMVSYNYTKAIILFFFIFSFGAVFASNPHSAEFFASNNTKIIDLQTAFHRLQGNAQQDLENNMVDVMQVHHVEQGKFADILGTYQMTSDKKITADNTKHFITSPHQMLSDEKIFTLAKELAIKLHQDSVAVFIPDNTNLADVTVTFTSKDLHINDIIMLLQQKLPAQYSKAFSLHIIKKHERFNKAIVAKVEWLGSSIDANLIKRAFPQEKITARYGRFYLVYQSGQVEQL
jgi:hypothetical protein